VRLKGGDPSVFGRSGEEKDYLEARGVAVEVVPGITAASAAAAQFGFPLTHRDEARRVTFATARVNDGAVVEGGWDVGADPQTTLVLYMARDAAGAVADRLIREGRPRRTPAIVVENAGRPEARMIRTDLGALGGAVADARLSGPVLLVIGSVAARAAVAEEAVSTVRRAANLA
jgi:uroporphyrin-III C-methyltransferase